MPAYNFKKKFAEMVENGFRQIAGEELPPGARVKRQTIRRKRKRPTRPGDTFYAFTGMRTKQCRELGRAPVVSVETIDIRDLGVTVNGRDLDFAEQDVLIRADGFDYHGEFFSFFERHYGLPLVGEMEIIKW